jgi:hypothetical protein
VEAMQEQPFVPPPLPAEMVQPGLVVPEGPSQAPYIREFYAYSKSEDWRFSDLWGNYKAINTDLVEVYDVNAFKEGPMAPLPVPVEIMVWGQEAKTYFVHAYHAHEGLRNICQQTLDELSLADKGSAVGLKSYLNRRLETEVSEVIRSAASFEENYPRLVELKDSVEPLFNQLPYGVVENGAFIEIVNAAPVVVDQAAQVVQASGLL